MTPLLPCPRLGSELGLSRLFIKDESQLPTGSFKSRGMAVAVSMARHSACAALAIPTAGNAGGALAAYGGPCRHGGLTSSCPRTRRVINQIEAYLAGAKVFLVNGLITDCGRIVREGRRAMGWFDMSTLKEPYRLEGKKTMGLELAEQSGWRAARRDPLPDRRRHRPDRHVEGVRGVARAGLAADRNGCRGWSACQSDGCAPIVRAFESGRAFRRAVRRTPTPSPAACACRRRSAIS